MKLVKDADEARKARKPSGETIIAASMDERGTFSGIMVLPFAHSPRSESSMAGIRAGTARSRRALVRYVRERHVTTVPEMIQR